MKKHDSRVYNENAKKARRKWSRILVQVFVILFAALFVLGLCLPLRPRESDLEKRELAKFPAFSFAALWDGSFFEDVSTWFADTFPFREQLLSAEAGVESLYGLRGEEIYGKTGQVADEIPTASDTAPTVTPAPVITTTPEPAGDPEDLPEDLPDASIHNTPEVAGTIYVADNRGFEIYYFNHGGADAYASMINTVKSKVGSQVNVYSLLAPTNFGVCLDENVQSSLGGSSQKDAFNYIYGMLDPSVRQVPVYDELVRHNAEYLYYNTDHHWTALGAYYAYRQFAQVKGITPHELSDYTEQVYPGFLGTFYSYSNQSEALKNNPDTVYAYVPIGTNDATLTNVNGETVNWNIVNDVSEYGAGQKYNCFIGGDNPYTEINNPSITDGSSCVIIKESYGNAFVPFLVDHYQTVYVIDYRYYQGNLTQFIQEKGVDDLLFLNNADALSERNSETMLGLFP